MDWFPFWLSLRVAVLGTALAMATGLPLAWFLAGRRSWAADLLDAASTLPLVLPPTVLGYYLLVVLGRESALGGVYERVTGEPLVFTWQAAVVAAWIHSLPLLIKSVRGGLETLNPVYLRAARTLGASAWKIAWRIQFPLAGRTILAAVALAFARSLGDFGVTLMIAGNIPGRTQTVSLAIYQAVESGRGDVARALVVAVSALCLLTLVAANRLAPRTFA